MATAAEIQATYKAIVRVDLNATTAQAVADAINNGTTTLAVYQAGLIQQSGATTQAALALSSFVTGTVPDSAKIDSLTAFAKTQNDYYTNVLKSGNAQLGAYEALGRAYAADATTTASFSARYGALSTADFVAAAYGQVFTIAPTAAATANLIAQVNYFTSLYTANGIPAAQASLQAKGAVLGQIIGYAATAPGATVPSPVTGDPAIDVSNLDNSLITALNTIASEARSGTESSVYGKALPGVTGQGVTLTVGTGQSVSIDATDAKLKATVFADTINGTIGGTAVSINSGAGDDVFGSSKTYDPTAGGLKLTQAAAANVITVDGSGGNDTLYGQLATNLSDQFKLANIEKVFLDGANKTADAKNWTGVQELWAFNTTGTTGVTNIASGVKVGIENSTNGASFTFADGVASAALTLKNVAGAVTTTGNTAFKTLTVDVASKSEISTLTTAAETVTITGSSAITIGALTNTVKTFDASAVTASVKLGGTTAFDSNAASTIKLGSGDDALKVGFTNAFSDTITLGAGKDAVTVDGNLANVSVTGTSASTFATVTDFTKGQDTITFSGLKAFTGSLVGVATLDAALALAAADANANTGISFEYGGSTYIFQDTTNDGVLGNGDGLIKLTGATGLVLGTDLLAV